MLIRSKRREVMRVMRTVRMQRVMRGVMRGRPRVDAQMRRQRVRKCAACATRGRGIARCALVARRRRYATLLFYAAAILLLIIAVTSSSIIILITIRYD